MVNITFRAVTVYDNGTEIEAYASAPFGEVTFDLKGEGVHNVKVFFRETPFRLIFDIISLITFVFCLFLVFSGNKKIIHNKLQSNEKN